MSLTLGTPPSFAVTLDGTDFTQPFSFTMTVGGGNVGWNITASATTFGDGAGHSASAPTLTGVTVSSCTGSGCPPTDSVTWPIALNGAAQKIYNAASGTGKGTIGLTANLTMPISGNMFAGSYSSTLTLAIVSGP